MFAFEESPATPGLLWAGSDDGLVHISRDNGKTWQNITPPGLPEFSTINVIDLNAEERRPRDRHRLPLRAERLHAVRVRDERLRQDVEAHRGRHERHSGRSLRSASCARIRTVPGLLFAGTEYGMYISFDDGAHWQPFQLNLPAVPIMDLQVSTATT